MICVVLAIVAIGGLCMVLGAGCAPRYPNDQDHAGAFESSDACIDCHFKEDGPRPPEDHWDGAGNVTYDHSICEYCHTAA